MFMAPHTYWPRDHFSGGHWHSKEEPAAHHVPVPDGLVQSLALHHVEISEVEKLPEGLRQLLNRSDAISLHQRRPPSRCFEVSPDERAQAARQTQPAKTDTHSTARRNVGRSSDPARQRRNRSRQAPFPGHVRRARDNRWGHLCDWTWAGSSASARAALLPKARIKFIKHYSLWFSTSLTTLQIR